MHKNDHLDLAKNFEKIADLLNGQENKEDYIIGFIIACHYAALHYVDLYLYDAVKPPETGSPLRHYDVDNPMLSRFHIMQKYLDPNVCAQYNFLHKKSGEARYDRGYKYFPVKYKQIEPFIKKALATIKKYVLAANK
jgi:hypothetical protein